MARVREDDEELISCDFQEYNALGLVQSITRVERMPRVMDRPSVAHQSSLICIVGQYEISMEQTLTRTLAMPNGKNKR